MSPQRITNEDGCTTYHVAHINPTPEQKDDALARLKAINSVPGIVFGSSLNIADIDAALDTIGTRIASTEELARDTPEDNLLHTILSALYLVKQITAQREAAAARKQEAAVYAQKTESEKLEESGD